MEMAGYRFSVRPADVDETLEQGVSPMEAVVYLAEIKSKAIPLSKGDVLITSDTVVSLDGEILGKPVDEKEAKNSLKGLSGRAHEVYTGVCIRSSEEIRTFFTCTRVFFYPLEEEEIADYISTGEPWDKAGGYGIQGRGALFVEKVEGDYYSVVGLPIARLVRELREMNVFPG